MKNSNTLLIIGGVAVIALAGFVVVSKMSRKTANYTTATGATGVPAVKPSTSDQITSAGVGLATQAGGELVNWLFGSGSNAKQTNSGSGTPVVQQTAAPNSSASDSAFGIDWLANLV